NRAYVFPGQGSQSVGMGAELFESSQAARETFQEADDSLGFPLSRLIFEGPAQELQNTANSQPAIMSVSVAAWRTWQEMCGPEAAEAQAVAGHSLGEYTSLVAAGVIDFSDAVQLVRKRGELMNQAAVNRPGSMAAILGLNELAFAQICGETGVELANINTDDQIVISGDKIAVARAMDLASARGAKKTIPLPVSGAFHSSLMVEAEAGLADAIGGLTFKDPKMPVIGNCESKPLTTGDEIRSELVNGLCQCVQWKNSVRHMVDSGVTEFVEFGSGGVLAGLIKRIDRGVKVTAVSDSAAMRKLAEIEA
ncbi:MAG TPA: [acyl-carrier-protein] S-malonyltransferase, partial [Dehalococcoidia bacterium]|nr:[acyl-carrier-protein] S-malonyltransferase [Dehalococcoidia bacterium]